MTLETAISFFRRQRVSQFRAACTVVRETAPGVFDSNTGAVGAPTTEIVYTGACNVREMTWLGTDVGIGGFAMTGHAADEIRLRRSELLFPRDTAVLEDDVVTVTASTHDANLVGQEYRITDVFLDAWQITRRALGEKITGD